MLPQNKMVTQTMKKRKGGEVKENIGLKGLGKNLISKPVILSYHPKPKTFFQHSLAFISYHSL